MKKIGYLLCSVLCCIACGKQPANRFTVEGELKGAGNDTLYLTGADSRYQRRDTIVCDRGRFSFTMEVDTVLPLYLILPDGGYLPLFTEKRGSTRITGDMKQPDGIRVNGGAANEELNLFYAHIDTTAFTLKEIQAEVDSFITVHPFSEVGIYLINTYFVNIEHPDNEDIEAVIKKLSGILQDNVGLQVLLKQLNERKNHGVNSSFPIFEWKDSKGDTLVTKDFQDKVLLLSFWASWDTASIQAQKELKALQAEFKEREQEIAFINISLDLNREKWLAAIAHDTLGLPQVCLPQGWETPFILQFGIDKIPANLLLNRYKRVAAFNLQGKELSDKIRSLLPHDNPKNKKRSLITRGRLK